jgi:hypothetical protein
MSHVSSNHPRDLDLPTHDAGPTASARRRTLLTRKTYVRSLLMIGAMVLILSVCGQPAPGQPPKPGEIRCVL